MERANILVVCTGNICRSPLIERLLQGALDERDATGPVTVHSAGTGALVGRSMDERSAAILADLGGSAEGFVARRLTAAMVREADLVLTATRAHRAEVVKLWPRALRYAFTAREMAQLVALDAADAPAAPEARDPAARVRDLAQQGRDRRGLYRPADLAELDIVDPFRRDDNVYQQMRAQVTAAVPLILRGLGVDPLR